MAVLQLKMATAPKEHIALLMKFMQFTEQVSEIDIESKEDWQYLKQQYEDEPAFVKMFKHCENDFGMFSSEFYFDYFQNEISHIYMRIIIGYEILFDNCCNPNADTLEFNEQIQKAFEALEKTTQDEQ